MNDKWRSIETAPKDQRILLYYPENELNLASACFIGRFRNRPEPLWRNDDDNELDLDYIRACQPSHWMPLPGDPPGIEDA